MSSIARPEQWTRDAFCPDGLRKQLTHDISAYTKERSLICFFAFDKCTIYSSLSASTQLAQSGKYDEIGDIPDDRFLKSLNWSDTHVNCKYTKGSDGESDELSSDSGEVGWCLKCRGRPTLQDIYYHAAKYVEYSKFPQEAILFRINK